MGEKLLTLVPIESVVVEVLMGQRWINGISSGQSGQLRMEGATQSLFDVRFQRWSTRQELRDGQRFQTAVFELMVEPNQALPLYGTSGLVALSLGQRSLSDVLFGDLTELVNEWLWRRFGVT